MIRDTRILSFILHNSEKTMQKIPRLKKLVFSKIKYFILHNAKKMVFLDFL